MLRGRVVDHGELGGAQALDLVAHAGGLLEVEVGGGLAHAGLQIGDDRLEIVPDGGGVLELAGSARAGRDQDVVALIHAVHDVGDATADALRRDAVLGIVVALLVAPAAGLRHGALHRAGDGVGIENDLAVDVARRAAARP